MLPVFESKRYKKSLKIVAKHKAFSVVRLEKVIMLIQKRVPLSAKYRDHKLKGKLEGLRECHIHPDVLLMYKILEDDHVLLLVDIGSHSKLL